MTLQGHHNRFPRLTFVFFWCRDAFVLSHGSAMKLSGSFFRQSSNFSKHWLVGLSVLFDIDIFTRAIFASSSFLSWKRLTSTSSSRHKWSQKVIIFSNARTAFYANCQLILWIIRILLQLLASKILNFMEVSVTLSKECSVIFIRRHYKGKNSFARE